jgi:hypothetical protein
VPAPFSVVADSKEQLFVFVLDDGLLVLSAERGAGSPFPGAVRARVLLVGPVSSEVDTKLVEAVNRTGFTITAAIGTLKAARVVAVHVDSSGIPDYLDFVRRDGSWRVTAHKKEPDRDPDAAAYDKDLDLHRGRVGTQTLLGLHGQQGHLFVDLSSGESWTTTDAGVFVIGPADDHWEPRLPPLTSDGQPIDPMSLHRVEQLQGDVVVLKGKSKDREAILLSGAHQPMALDRAP